MRFIGLHIIHTTETDSTNAHAWRLLQQKLVSEGSIISAGYQNAGRGQTGTSWESEAGKNLLFSCVLKPDFLNPSNQFILNKTLSLAVHDTLSNLIPEHVFSIKWPNDIYTGKKKIAGMLIENTIVGNTMDYSIAGIGININQTVFVSDAPNPVSFKLLTGHTYDLDKCLTTLCKYLDTWWEALKKKQITHIDASYLKHLMGYGQKMLFSSQEGLFQASICGVNDFGKLILEKNNTKRSYDTKEIQFVLDDQ